VRRAGRFRRFANRRVSDSRDFSSARACEKAVADENPQKFFRAR
jgi:hypothetical protein